MESEFRISDYVRILKKRYLFLLVPFVVLFSGSVGVATLLPPLYQSNGVILIESPQISKEIVAGAIDSAARERIEVIKQRVMTRANLIRIANQFAVFRDEEKKLSSSEIVDEMRSASTVDFVISGTSSRAPTIAFTVSFQHRSPQTAARVANEIVTLFMDENVKTRTKIATETTDFLNQEAKKLEDHLAEIESKIANYKQENSSALPENLDIRIGIRERTENQIRETEREIKAHEEEMRFLDIQLTALKSGYGQIGVPVPRFVPLPSAGNNAGEVLDTTNPDLEKLRAEYNAAKSKYAPSHPDLKRLTRELTAMEEQLIAEGGPAGIGIQVSRLEEKRALAEETGDIAGAEEAAAGIAQLQEKLLLAPTEEIDPRVLQQQQQISLAEAQAKAEQERAKAQLDLNTANVEAKIGVTNERITSLREQKQQLQDRLAEIERTILQTPLVDRALKSLNRDYENAQQKYNEVRAKAMEAQIAENVEEASKAERFVLVEPPTVPDEPIKPDRRKLVLMGLGLSLAAGVAGVFGVEFIDGSIRGSTVLTSVMTVEPLAVIPYIVTAKESRTRTRARIILLIGAITFVVAALAAVHFLYKPLDEVFYKVMDRFA